MDADQCADLTANFIKNHGLDGEIIRISASPTAMQALMSGDLNSR
jgi:ABC-type nitrate/sulfonate/bicarbonate transport system substrate-binding protein